MTARLSTPRPARRRRLSGIDAARGVALVGMIATHVWAGGAPGDPISLADVVAGGRASALFAVLAGCGLALATGGTTPWTGRRLAAGRRALAARAGVVAAVGLFVGSLPTPAAVILAYYGLLFLVAVPVLGWGPRRLVAAAAVAAVLTPVLSHLLRRASPRGPGPNVGWENVFAAPADLAATLTLYGYYPVLTWTTYLFLGLAIGRLPLASAAVAVRIAVTGVLLAVAGLGVQAFTLATVGGPAALGATIGESGQQVLHRLATSSFGTSPTASWWWLGTAGRHSGTAPDLLHTGGSALVVLGLLLLVGAEVDSGRMPFARPVVGALVTVGSVTLTLYALHVTLLGVTDNWAGLPDVTPGAVFAWHVGIALAVAALVRAPHRRGPLEALAAAAGRTAAGGRAAGGAPGAATPRATASRRADSTP